MSGIKIVTKNRKARHEYRIEETAEAGIRLKGTEVKAIREGRINLGEAYCDVEGGEMYLINAHISPYSHGNQQNHEPRRRRKLLLHKHEIRKFDKATSQQGYTIVPLMLYFKRGIAKLEIGIGKGKKLHDKREDIAERDTKRRMQQQINKYNRR
jgi:SsrA-binding protein